MSEIAGDRVEGEDRGEDRDGDGEREGDGKRDGDGGGSVGTMDSVLNAEMKSTSNERAHDSTALNDLKHNGDIPAHHRDHFRIMCPASVPTPSSPPVSPYPLKTFQRWQAFMAILFCGTSPT